MNDYNANVLQLYVLCLSHREKKNEKFSYNISSCYDLYDALWTHCASIILIKTLFSTGGVMLWHTFRQIQ